MLLFLDQLFSLANMVLFGTNCQKTQILLEVFKLNSVVFLLAGIAIMLQPRSNQLWGLYAGRAVFICSLEICWLCPPVSSVMLSWGLGLLMLKIDCAGVPLYTISVLLNQQESLCPLLLSSCFSIFSFMRCSLNSVCVL